ncbi:MAG: MFS transporter [Acetobacteraceae bacterium]
MAYANRVAGGVPVPGPSTAPRALLPLYVVVFVGFLGYSLMITVFTPMLLHGHAMLPESASASYRSVVLGGILSLYPFGQFIGSPVQGALSDRFGRRPVLLASLSVTTFCYAIIAFSLAAGSVKLLALGLVIAGLAEANIVIAQAAISDVIAAAERNRYFGYIYMSASLAYVVGPLGGGKLADPRLVSWFSDATPFWCMFALLAATAAAVLFRFRETMRAGPPPTTIRLFDNILSLGLVFTRPGLRRFFLTNFLIYLAIFGFFRAYPMYLVGQFQLGVSAMSEFVAWVGVPIVLVNLGLTGFLSRHVPLKALTVCSAAATGLLAASVVAPRTTTLLWPLLFLTAGALAACLPSCATLLSQAAGEREQGQVMGDNQALQVAAEAVSGLMSGLLAAMLVKLPLIVFGGIAVGAALVAALAL